METRRPVTVSVWPKTYDMLVGIKSQSGATFAWLIHTALLEYAKGKAYELQKVVAGAEEKGNG